MKKMLLAAMVAIVGFTSSAYAQFSAGTTVVGGGLTYNKGQSQFYGQMGYNVTEKKVSISPRLGTFVADDVEIGVQATYVYGVFSSNNDWVRSSSSDMIMLAPYLRKYFTLNEWAGFYMQGGLAYGAGRIGGEDLAESKQRTRAFVAMVAPGITVRLGERVGIDLQANLLEYTRTTYGLENKYSDTKSDPFENFAIGPNFSKLSLGISFFL